MKVELADIEVFLTLSKELHFARTGSRLRISPARVSQRIQALEREVGGALFERTSRRTALTPLGEQLYDDLHPVYEQLTAALDAARSSARAATGVLRIGFTSTTGGEDLDGLVRLLEQTHPGIEATMREVRIDEPLDALRDNEVDVLADWLLFDAPDMTLGPTLAEYGMVLMTAADHPLADRPGVRVEDLADYELNDLSHLRIQAGDRTFFPDRTSSGRRLRLRPVSTWQEALSKVARGKSVHVTVASMPRQLARSDLVFIPINDLPPVKLGLVWHTPRENARIRALADLAASRRSRPIAATAQSRT